MVPFSMEYTERKSHSGGVYPTKYTSRMETVRLKYEEEADTGIIVRKQKERNVARGRKVPNKA